MAAEFHSKTGTVSRPQYEMYMAFVDLRNFERMIPEDQKGAVTADFDTLSASIRNFNIGVKVSARVPYSRIELVDYDAPFGFHVVLHFDESATPGKTDFSIDVEADLNLMMKMMLGSKIKEALDKVVDGMVAVSEGRMPEGIDPSALSNMKF